MFLGGGNPMFDCVSHIKDVTSLVDVAEGYYVLLLIKGRSTVTTEPIYLFHYVKDEDGGWGSYLVHGINLLQLVPNFRDMLKEKSFKSIISSNEVREEISKEIKRVFQTQEIGTIWTDLSFMRIKYSYREKKEKLYYYYGVLVTFTESDEGAVRLTLNELRKFQPWREWKWFTTADMKKDVNFMLKMGDVVSYFVDVETGIEKTPLHYSIKNVRLSFLYPLYNFFVNWENVLTLIVLLLTVTSLISTVLTEGVSFYNRLQDESLKESIFNHEKKLSSLLAASNHLNIPEKQELLFLSGKFEEYSKMAASIEEKKIFLHSSLVGYRLLQNTQKSIELEEHIKLISPILGCKTDMNSSILLPAIEK